MLSAKISPSLAKFAQLRYASYRPLLMQSITTAKFISCSAGWEPNRFAATDINFQPNSKTLNSTIYRSYTSNQPSLPSKTELEKIFFKLTVIVWDLVWKITEWAWAKFKVKIVLNPAVQTYWKSFNDKLQEARRGQ